MIVRRSASYRSFFLFSLAGSVWGRLPQAVDEPFGGPAKVGRANRVSFAYRFKNADIDTPDMNLDEEFEVSIREGADVFDSDYR